VLLDDVKDKAGVYVIRWASKEQGIWRLKDVDPKSIIYIGYGKNLKRRIGSLWKKLREPQSKVRHTMVNTMVFCNLVESIRPEELEIAWVVFQEKEEAETQEWATIRFYAQKYGEPPPLNLFVGRKKFAIVGLAEVERSKVISPVSNELKSLVDP
jgi:hypothetical protein